MKQKLFLLFLLALALRFIFLNQSLWLDEGTTARVLQQFNLAQIITQFSPHDFHPPLYYLLMKLWTYFFGYSEVALRMPSVLFSLSAGWFVYLIGKKLKSEKVGLWAAAFFLFNPLIVYYSQEARMYMMVTFLLSAALYLFIVILNSFQDLPSKNQMLKRVQQDIVLFNFFVSLSFLTFYGSIFFIAAIYLWLVIKKQFKQLLLLLPGFILAFLLVSPLLYQQYMNSREQLVLVTNWSNVLGTVNLKNLLLIPLKFSIGRISWQPKTVYYVVSGLWTIFTFYFVILGTPTSRRRTPESAKRDSGQDGLPDGTRQARMTLTFLFVVPIILGVVFSFFSPLLQYFRFLYLIPLMALLIAIGTNRKWQKIVLLIGFTVFSLVYLLNPNFHREDWKSLAKSLPNKAKVCMIPTSIDPLLYYRKDITIITLTQCDFGNKVVVIPYTADIHGVDYKKTLKENGFYLEREKSFRELQIQRWSKK